MDQAQIRESPPATDRHPNHWATPPTREGDDGRLMSSDTTILCRTLVFCEEGRQAGIAGVTPNLPVWGESLKLFWGYVTAFLYYLHVVTETFILATRMMAPYSSPYRIRQGRRLSLHKHQFQRFTARSAPNFSASDIVPPAKYTNELQTWDGKTPWLGCCDDIMSNFRIHIVELRYRLPL